jgi:hypothetical protein
MNDAIFDEQVHKVGEDASTLHQLHNVDVQHVQEFEVGFIKNYKNGNSLLIIFGFLFPSKYKSQSVEHYMDIGHYNL